MKKLKNQILLQQLFQRFIIKKRYYNKLTQFAGKWLSM